MNVRLYDNGKLLYVALFDRGEQIVRPPPSAQEHAKREGIEVRLYRVIYDAIEDITAAMKGMKSRQLFRR